jgi:hypothetical protein
MPIKVSFWRSSDMGGRTIGDRERRETGHRIAASYAHTH